MNLLQGIQLHELILMVLGFILGLVLIFIFLFTALKNKPNLKLLYGFIAPLVMIGYPSIRSIEFGKDVIKIDKLVEKVNANPTDTTVQRELIQNLQELPASRCKTSSDALAAIANAQASLGQYDSARVMSQRAVDLDKKNEKAIESNKIINEKWQMQKLTEQRIGKLNVFIKEWELRPNDLQVWDSISTHYNNLVINSKPVHLDNSKILVVAQAAAIVGEKQRAEQITNNVLKVTPNQKEAEKLKEDIKSKRTDNRYNTPKVRTKIVDKAKEAKQKVEALPAPAPVYQDTNLRIRFIPKTGIIIKKWNAKE